MAKILVIYHSDTGNTAAVAKLVAEGAESAGATVELVKAGDFDQDAAAAADGIALGSPDYFSYVAGEVKTIFDRIVYDKRFHGKPYAGFGTHGGGAKVLGVIEHLAHSCKLEPVGPGVLVKNAPEGDDVDKARALGVALAEAVK